MPTKKLNELVLMPKPAAMQMPETVYETESGELRYKPFDDHKAAMVEYDSQAAAIRANVEASRQAYEEAKLAHQELVKQNLLGSATDAELTESEARLTEMAKLLESKESLCAETISSLAPHFEISEMHEGYHADFVAYAENRNLIALHKAFELREQFLDAIDDYLAECSKATGTRSLSKDFISDFYKTDATSSDLSHRPIKSPVPENVQGVLIKKKHWVDTGVPLSTEKELEKMKKHSIFHRFEANK